MNIFKKGWQLLEAGGTKEGAVGGLRGHSEEDPGGGMEQEMMLGTRLEMHSGKEVLHARGGTTCRLAYTDAGMPPKGPWPVCKPMCVREN